MQLRSLLDGGRVAAGGWCGIPSAFGAEVMGRAGFDWICVDTRHGLIGYHEMTGMLQALSATGTPSLVRVPWNHAPDIMHALDAGANGVIVPMVNSRREAEDAVSACRYPPEGIRSWGPKRAAWTLDNYTPERANRATLCIIQIETRQAVEGLDEIIDTPGLDGVYVGPSDLAISYGLPPRLRAEEMEHEHVLVIESILERCQARGLHCGIYCEDAQSAATWINRGFRLVTIGSDSGYIHRTAARDLQVVRTGAKELGAHR